MYTYLYLFSVIKAISRNHPKWSIQRGIAFIQSTLSVMAQDILRLLMWESTRTLVKLYHKGYELYHKVYDSKLANKSTVIN
jgi:hypothetical protein